MNWLDITIIVSLAIPAMIGLQRGLTRTLLPLIGVALGIFLAGRYYGPLSDSLLSWLGSPSQSKIVAFVVILVLVIVATMLLASLINKSLSLVFLGWVDRLGGAGFGLATGALLVSASLAVVTKFEFLGIQDTVTDSGFAAFFLDRFPMVLALLPEEFDSIRQFLG